MTVCLFAHLSGGPLSLDVIPSGRLKNLRDVDKWLSLRFCYPVRSMSITKTWTVLLQLDWVS